MNQEISGQYGNDPLALFAAWLEEAEKTEPSNPNAAALATVSPEGLPGVRMVLLKGLDGRGLVFYTNFESEKGRALLARPYAEMCFYWKSLERQVRIAGPAETVGDEEADAYFAARPRGSRIGAWASAQSRPLGRYEDLLSSVAAFTKQFGGQDNIPRPPHWSGFRIVPERMEFWLHQPGRLHKRFAYAREGTGPWSAAWLSP